MQDHKSLCAAVTLCAHLVNIQTDKQTHRQQLTSLYEKPSEMDSFRVFCIAPSSSGVGAKAREAPYDFKIYLAG